MNKKNTIKRRKKVLDKKKRDNNINEQRSREKKLPNEGQSNMRQHVNRSYTYMASVEVRVPVVSVSRP